jgi:ABC-type multidrug transport system ATPase subunit
VPQDLAIYPDRTGRENLAFFGKLYELSGHAVGLVDHQETQSRRQLWHDVPPELRVVEPFGRDQRTSIAPARRASTI